MPTPDLVLPEASAARVWWLRAFESPTSPPWTAEDAERVTREAREALGERAPPAAFLGERGGRAAERLAQRGAGLPTRLVGGAPWRWIGLAVAVAALVLGFTGERVGSGGRIHLLAPPLLALLAWNLAVYGALLGQALVRRRDAGGAWAAAFLRRLGPGPHGAGPASRFARDWTSVTAPLQQARGKAVMHAGAALLALGALASLYLRGLAFEYRAGWESTFLSAEAVHRLLGLVLGPAAAATALPLPDVEALRQLQFSRGPGENAARWIHLWAATVAAAVVLPRALLTGWSVARAARLARRVPLPSDGWARRWTRAADGRAQEVRLLAVNHQPTPERLEALGRWWRESHGEPAWDVVTVREDGLDASLPPPRPHAMTVLLFKLGATPERETHGRLLQRLTQDGRALQVLVDESAFRERFGGAVGEQRLAQRREAWRRLLADAGVPAQFVDLRGPQGAAEAAA